VGTKMAFHDALRLFTPSSAAHQQGLCPFL
jgi:hypothetical protein